MLKIIIYPKWIYKQKYKSKESFNTLSCKERLNSRKLLIIIPFSKCCQKNCLILKQLVFIESSCTHTHKYSIWQILFLFPLCIWTLHSKDLPHSELKYVFASLTYFLCEIFLWWISDRLFLISSKFHSALHFFSLWVEIWTFCAIFCIDQLSYEFFWE